MSTTTASVSCGGRLSRAVAEARHFSRTDRTRWDISRPVSARDGAAGCRMRGRIRGRGSRTPTGCRRPGDTPRTHSARRCRTAGSCRCGRSRCLCGNRGALRWRIGGRTDRWTVASSSSNLRRPSVTSGRCVVRNQYTTQGGGAAPARHRERRYNRIWVVVAMRFVSMNVSTKKMLGVAAAAWLLAAPAFADKKLDDAIARADQQLQRGHPEEGVKTLQRVAEQTPGPEAYSALARFQWKTGDADGAAKSAAKAVELSASAAP